MDISHRDNRCRVIGLGIIEKRKIGELKRLKGKIERELELREEIKST